MFWPRRQVQRGPPPGGERQGMGHRSCHQAGLDRGRDARGPVHAVLRRSHCHNIRGWLNAAELLTAHDVLEQEERNDRAQMEGAAALRVHGGVYSAIADGPDRGDRRSTVQMGGSGSAEAEMQCVAK